MIRILLTLVGASHLQLDFVRRDRPNNVLIDLIEKTRKVVRSLDNKGYGRMAQLFKTTSTVSEDPIDEPVRTAHSAAQKVITS